MAMKNKVCIFTLFISAFVINITAQNITGKIIDTDNTPIEFANVVLYNYEDSSFFSGTISDSLGCFSISQPKDNRPYILKISHIGYLSITLNTPLDNIGTVTLHQDTSLQEITIKGQIPSFHLENDGFVANIKNTYLAKSGTANDVLQLIPNINGRDGEYNVFGKGHALIFINGKELRNTSLLDNISSHDIKSVKVVTNPGTKYRSDIKAVIEINTLSPEIIGWGMELRSSIYQSQNTDFVEQVNINYIDRKFCIFGTFKYSDEKKEQEAKMLQNVYVDNYWQQENSFLKKNNDKIITNSIGLNYDVSENNKFGLQYTLNLTPNSNENIKMESVVNKNGIYNDSYSTNSNKKNKIRPSNLFNICHNGLYGKLKTNLDIDFLNNTMSNQTYTIEKNVNNESETIMSDGWVGNRMVAVKMLAEYPVFKGNLSFGNEYVYTRREDNYTNYSSSLPSVFSKLKEKNYYSYLDFKKLTPIGLFNIGLRFEHNIFNYYENDILQKKQSQSHNRLCPQLSYGIQISDLQMSLNYNQKTTRPKYSQLGNEIVYGNRLTLQKGNPLLAPSHIHDLALSGMYKFIQFMVNYQKINNDIFYCASQDSNNPAVSTISFENIKKRKNLIVYLMASPKFSFYNPSISISLQKQWFEIESNFTKKDMGSPIAQLCLKNGLNLPYNFTVIADIMYQTKGCLQNIYLDKDILYANISINKEFLNNRLMVQLKGTDIFHGIKDSNILYFKKMDLLQYNKYDSREIVLTLKYRFNISEQKYHGRGAGNNEKTRL